MRQFNAKGWFIGVLLLVPMLYACQTGGGGGSSITTDSEGATGQGQNDTTSTAQALSALDATAFGYIDSEETGDVDFFSFEVTTGGTVYFDVDFANDVETPDTDDDDGLDAVISVFDSEGTLIVEGDDIGFPPDPGSEPNGDFDPFVELDLEPGNYYVAISAWANYSGGSSDGYDSSAGTSSGEYCLSVRTGEGVDAAPNNCG